MYVIFFILKSFLNGFSSNQHIAQKPLSEMYTSHFEHVWSSTFQQQQKTDSQHITKYFFIKTFHLYQVVSFERLITVVIKKYVCCGNIF